MNLTEIIMMTDSELKINMSKLFFSNLDLTGKIDISIGENFHIDVHKNDRNQSRLGYSYVLSISCFLTKSN